MAANLEKTQSPLISYIIYNLFSSMRYWWIFQCSCHRNRSLLERSSIESLQCVKLKIFFSPNRHFIQLMNSCRPVTSRFNGSKTRKKKKKKKGMKKRLMAAKWQVVCSLRSQSRLGCEPATFVQVQRQNHLAIPPTFLGLVQGKTNCFTLWIQTVNNRYCSWKKIIKWRASRSSPSCKPFRTTMNTILLFQ